MRRIKEISKDFKSSQLLDELLQVAQTFNWSADQAHSSWQDPLSQLWVCLEGEELVACCGGQVVLDEATIHYFWVKETYREKGLGRYLLNELLKQWQEEGLVQVNLEVRVSNKPAQALYRACDFELMGIRKNYYQAPLEDACLMQWHKKEADLG